MKLKTYEITYRPHLVYESTAEGERKLVTNKQLFTATVRETNKELAKVRLALNVMKEVGDLDYGHAVAMSSVRFIESIKELSR